MKDIVIAPNVTSDTKEFWSACKKKRLTFPRCMDCNQIYWPPSPFCPTCASGNIVWEELSGRGQVYSYVVFRRAFDSRLEDSLPYTVAVVQLLKGPKILSNIVHCPCGDVYVQMPVQLVWRCGDTGCIPQFEPCAEEA